MKNRMEISDDSGFLAIVDASQYPSFVAENWQLDQLMEHFTTAMNKQQMVMWQSNNDGGGFWRIDIKDEPSEKEAHRSLEQTIRVTDGKLFLTNYDDLTMAAQYEKYKIPSDANDDLVLELPNGLYKITVRQLFDPAENNYNEEDGDDDFDFEMIIAAADQESAAVDKVIWSTI